MIYYPIDYAYTCHIGKVRKNNEDNFWCCGEKMPAQNQGIDGVVTGSASQSRMPVLAVFDGMGGESCGEVASCLATDRFSRCYDENKKNLRRNPEGFIRQAVEDMNTAICSYARENRISSMGTTMAMMLFGARSIHACNLGDSRIYQSQAGQFRQISTDHVLGGSLFGKAPLTQYLGMPEDFMVLDAAPVSLDYQEESRYLLCSDGLTDMLPDGEIADILTRDIPVDQTVEVLLERALKKGGRDNVTIILCQIGKGREYSPIRAWMEQYRR